MKKILCVLIFFFPLSALAQNYDNMGNRSPRVISEEDSSSLAVETANAQTDRQVEQTSNPAGQQTVPENVEIGSLNVTGQIKAGQGLCINGDCKDNWPVLKCADFTDRPAGETGEEFCKKTGKTCLAVFIGNGSSFFDECSTPPMSTHKTRCCWVE